MSKHSVLGETVGTQMRVRVLTIQTVGGCLVVVTANERVKEKKQMKE